MVDTMLQVHLLVQEVVEQLPLVLEHPKLEEQEQQVQLMVHQQQEQEEAAEAVVALVNPLQLELTLEELVDLAVVEQVEILPEVELEEQPTLVVAEAEVQSMMVEVVETVDLV
jgi:hypothetical protein